jgi:hypothetical protein
MGATDSPVLSDLRWLEPFCPAALRARLHALVVDGERLLVGPREWAVEAADAISAVESTLSDRDASDELVELVAEVVGLAAVYRIAEDFAEVAMVVACGPS